MALHHRARSVNHHSPRNATGFCGCPAHQGSQSLRLGTVGRHRDRNLAEPWPETSMVERLTTSRPANLRTCEGGGGGIGRHAAAFAPIAAFPAAFGWSASHVVVSGQSASLS